MTSPTSIRATPYEAWKDEIKALERKTTKAVTLLDNSNADPMRVIVATWTEYIASTAPDPDWLKTVSQEQGQYSHVQSWGRGRKVSAWRINYLIALLRDATKAQIVARSTAPREAEAKDAEARREAAARKTEAREAAVRWTATRTTTATTDTEFAVMSPGIQTVSFLDLQPDRDADYFRSPRLPRHPRKLERELAAMRLEDLKLAEEEGKKSSSWSGGVVPGYRQMVGPVLPYPANPAHCPNAPCQHVRPLSETGRVQSAKLWGRKESADTLVISAGSVEIPQPMWTDCHRQRQ
ncbi:predicted protein [Postia placenta Mad-698-R]|nr:predicted protein [Postia placenta Mad-698-R]